MFAAIREFVRRRRVRNALSRYVSPDALDAMLSNDGSETSSELKKRKIAFVLIELRSEDSTELKGMLAEAAGLIAAHGGLWLDLVSHLVVAGFGLNDCSPSSNHRAFISAVMEKFENRARIAYSEGVGDVGNLGNDTCFSYSFIHPAFPRALGALVSTPFGQSREVEEPHAV